MKYLFLIFLYLALTACGGGHKSEGSSESTRTVFVHNWPSELSVNEDEPLSYDPKTQSNLEGEIVFHGENMPDWIQVNPSTGALSGVPTNDDSGQEYSDLKIIANSDGSKVLEIGPFSIDVVAVNDAPEIEPQTLQANKIGAVYEANLEYLDIDNTVAQLIFEITAQSEFFDVTIIPRTNRFRVTPKSYDAFTQELSFSVKIDDGEAQTDSVLIKFTLSDDEEFSLTSNVPNESYITIEPFYLISSHPFRLSDITYNEEPGDCEGNIQLSPDNFTSCIDFDLTPINELNTEFEISFDAELGKKYSFRNLNSLQSLFGFSAKENLNHSFTVINQLIITEFSGSYYNERNRWLEVHNQSGNVVNLKDYAIRTDGVRRVDDALGNTDWIRYENRVFRLPDFDIHPGQYVVLRSQDFYEIKENTDYTIYLGDLVLNPYWWNDGGEIELLKFVEGDFLTVDYVKFGSHFLNKEYSPETEKEWNGEPLEQLALPDNENAEGYSYQRNISILDSNTSQDWSKSTIATPGNPNDLICSEDNDRDGLPDCSEEEGSTFFGLDLYALGARKEQKDIFIEVDYMNSLDEGVIPRQEALRKVRDVFAEQGVKVHFDVGELFGEESEFNLGGGNSFEFSECISFQSVADCKNLYQIKSQNMAVKRLHSFHYMVFGYQTANEDIKGIAEINGNDSMILLGNWDLDSSDEMSKNELINYQAATVMHELGHNLGLRHGGSNDLNLKPNYLSVMNYMYTFNGLPEIGNNEGDRYYTLYWGVNAGSCHGMNNSLALVNSPYGSPEDFRIDYSNGTSIMLNENLIFEKNGLGRIDSSSVDYDCNGIVHGGSYELSLADYPNREQYTLLHDHDDWTALNLVFQNTYSGVNNLKAGANRSNMPEDGRITLGNDRSEIAVEIPVTDEFNRLRNLRKSELRSHN